MKAKQVYSFHYATREYIGIEHADESPLEPGVWHIPANATEIEPPVAPDGKVAVFGTTEWLLVPRETVPIA